MIRRRFGSSNFKRPDLPVTRPQGPGPGVPGETAAPLDAESSSVPDPQQASAPPQPDQTPEPTLASDLSALPQSVSSLEATSPLGVATIDDNPRLVLASDDAVVTQSIRNHQIGRTAITFEASSGVLSQDGAFLVVTGGDELLAYQMSDLTEPWAQCKLTSRLRILCAYQTGDFLVVVATTSDATVRLRLARQSVRLREVGNVPSDTQAAVMIGPDLLTINTAGRLSGCDEFQRRLGGEASDRWIAIDVTQRDGYVRFAGLFVRQDVHCLTVTQSEADCWTPPHTYATSSEVKHVFVDRTPPQRNRPALVGLADSSRVSFWEWPDLVATTPCAEEP